MPAPRTIAYWVTTGLISLPMLAGGVMDLSQAPDVIAGMAHLGYPAYFAVLLGTWKLLGVAAVLVPGLPRLKEWAYAGFVFDLTAASISHAVSGDPASNVVIPLVLLAIAMTSWATRPASRRLGSVLPNAVGERAAA